MCELVAHDAQHVTHRVMPATVSGACGFVSAPQLPDLQRSVIRGAVWKASAGATAQAIAFAVSIAWARLLTPGEYGLAAMVFAISALGSIFSDVTITSGLVQRERIDEADRVAIFWLSVGVGLVASAGMFLAADALAAFYGEPAVANLFRALSPVFLVNALAAVPRALLVRQLRFRGIELQLIGATLVGAVVGVSVAVLGFGPWALVTADLSAALFSCSILWIMSPVRVRRPTRSHMRSGLGRSGGHVFGANLLSYAGANLDNILIGRTLGPVALGPYAFSYNAMLVPLQRVVTPVQDLLFPALSRLQGDPDRLAGAWLRASRFVAAVVVPLFVLVVIETREVVAVALGNRWQDAAPILQALALAGLFQVVGRLNTAVFQALGHTRTLFRWSVVSTIANVTSFFVGIHWGALGVAIAFTVANSVVQPINMILAARIASVRLPQLVRAFSPVLEACLALVAVAVPLRLLLVHTNAPAALSLLVVSTLGLVAFAGVLFARSPEIRMDAATLVRRGESARSSEPFTPDTSPAPVRKRDAS